MIDITVKIALALLHKCQDKNDIMLNFFLYFFTRKFQTGQHLGFLYFFKTLGKYYFGEITRKDIAAYVEHEQDRGLKIPSYRGDKRPKQKKG